MIDQYRKCDGKDCKEFTLDPYQDKWIVVGDGGFKKYGGRDKDKCGITEVFVANGADFCSWKCLRSRTGRK